MIGREKELDRLGAFIAAGFSPTGLVLAGEPGIGKTTLWEAGIAAARERGIAVHATRAGEAEAQLSFAALIDLAGGLDLAGLPAPQRSALEIALLRREPEGAPPQPHAIGLGLRNAFAARAPALIAIDDVQWLDAPSAEALAFAARRLHDQSV
ncbi:MAG TPA: ATP-binding protein, partial [Polyangiaceae bacterium]|nr:ATP-binding protein [Polyangiaceae bacterium]